eukprot:106866-Rhodomonas_salina.1
MAECAKRETHLMCSAGTIKPYCMLAYDSQIRREDDDNASQQRGLGRREVGRTRRVVSEEPPFPCPRLARHARSVPDITPRWLAQHAGSLLSMEKEWPDMLSQTRSVLGRG